jgi:hypothetical protein
MREKKSKNKGYGFMPTNLWQKEIIPPTIKYTQKDRFDLFVGDNCDACQGMEEMATEFAQRNRMVYRTYSNSKEVPHIPCIRYCEFYIVGNKAFERLGLIVKAKREGII